MKRSTRVQASAGNARARRAVQCACVAPKPQSLKWSAPSGKMHSSSAWRPWNPFLTSVPGVQRPLTVCCPQRHLPAAAPATAQLRPLPRGAPVSTAGPRECSVTVALPTSAAALAGAGSRHRHRDTPGVGVLTRRLSRGCERRSPSPAREASLPTLESPPLPAPPASTCQRFPCHPGRADI
jgi:hypothetical protein